MRHILLHTHIFKNAGSTVEATLERHFGTNYTTNFNPTGLADGRVYPQALYQHLDKYPHIQALSSYQFFGRNFNDDLEKKLLFENEKNYCFHDCIIIRHPLVRLVSMYVYYRTMPLTEEPLHITASHSSFGEFLNILIGHYPHLAINPQTTIFGADNYGVPPSFENLERALARLKKATILGTVEEYDKTMVVAEYFLQPLFKGIQLHYPRHENVSNYTLLPGYNGSLESIKEILGASYFSDLCDLNDLDIELWHAVSKELRRRASYIKDFPLRFGDFSKRCLLTNAAFEEQEKIKSLFTSAAAIPSPPTDSKRKKKNKAASS